MHRTASCTRRDLLYWIAASVVALVPPRLSAISRPPVALRLRLGLLAERMGSDEAGRGFEMGLDEAARAAGLVGAQLESRTAGSVRALAGAGCTAVVGSLPSGVSTAAAQREADEHAVLFLNAASQSDSLRTARCGDLSFHIAPSLAMRAAAGAGRGGRARAVAWHERLTRFGAEQLNDRFRHRYGTGMGEAAWCGWMAVKVAWESAVRARSGAAADMAAVLLRPGTRFDGHKGRALRFGTDRQLLQPLYVLPDLEEIRAGAQSAHGRGQCGR